MRSCNLCGDLVEHKDRIQPTSKKATVRRPTSYQNIQPNYPNSDNTEFAPPISTTAESSYVQSGSENIENANEYSRDRNEEKHVTEKPATNPNSESSIFIF
jgi:hypothetical protein